MGSFVILTTREEVAYQPRLWERLGFGFSLKRYLAGKGLVPAVIEEHLRAVHTVEADR